MTVRFAEEKVLPDDGQVNHALRGALSYLLKDYLVCLILLTQLQIIKIFINLKFLSIVSAIHSSTRNRTYSRKTEFTKIMVLYSTNNGHNVNIESNYIYN